MKKTVASILLAIMISSMMVSVQAGGNVQCVINIMPKLPNLSADPVGLFIEFSACAGDQTWDLMAPFLGGFMRVVLTSINTVNDGATNNPLQASDYATGFFTLDLYNLVMDMVKQAVGELLGFIEAGAFSYQYSNV